MFLNIIFEILLQNIGMLQNKCCLREPLNSFCVFLNLYSTLSLLL